MKCLLALLPLAVLSACGQADARTELVIQRFFGACQAEFGTLADPGKAQGECGIITAMINQFEAANPDIKVIVNTVFWPGYDQLTAQLAANGPPDLVTMHSSAIPDYEARNLLEPLDGDLMAVGISPTQFTAAARAGVSVGGKTMGLPIDVWAPLWHVNMNLFRKAGLVADDKPVLPGSPRSFTRKRRSSGNAPANPISYRSPTRTSQGRCGFFTPGCCSKARPCSRTRGTPTSTARKAGTRWTS